MTPGLGALSLSSVVFAVLFFLSFFQPKTNACQLATSLFPYIRLLIMIRELSQ
jgi:hypothetical protein